MNKSETVRESSEVRVSLVLNKLFSGRIEPFQAASAIESELLERQKLSKANAHARLRNEHNIFQESNLLNQIQRVNWDHTIIIIEGNWEIPEEERISKNRLVPIGTPSFDPEYRDLSF
jgi:hypothetical protein